MSVVFILSLCWVMRGKGRKLSIRYFDGKENECTVTGTGKNVIGKDEMK